MEINSITLSGVILETSEIRRSPAGIPHLRFMLEHRSRQVETQRPREVSCRIAVEVRGHAIDACNPLIRQGQRVVVSGFLDKSGFKDDGSRFVLHAHMIKTPEPEAG